LVPLAAGCSTDEDQPAPGAGQEVKLGLLAPLKGAQKGAGQAAQHGAQLAADVINGLNPSIQLPLAESAGLPDFGNARVKIVVQDTSGAEPEAAAANAVSRLVADEGASVLIGAYDPQVTEFASQRAERYEVPFLNADSPPTFLTDRGLDWFFRLGPSWRTAGEAYFSILRAQEKANGAGARIAVLYSQDKAGQDVSTTVTRLAEEGGFPAPVGFPFSPTATDLGPTVDALRQARPEFDVVMVYATPETVKPLIAAFGSRQYRPKAAFSFGLGYLTTEDYRSSAAVVAGLARSVSWSSETADRNKPAHAVMDLYQQRFKTPMTEAAAASFTAVMTAAQAVNAARSTDPAAIRTALLSLDVPGDQTVMPWGGVQFDETHQNVKAQVLIEQFVSFSFKVVYPGDAAGSRRLIYPAADAAAQPGTP
jgi:branched-chain amino acid transport system substrate-binding protein